MIAIDLLSNIFGQNSYSIYHFTHNDFKCFFASSKHGSDYYLVLDKDFFEDEDIIYITTKGIQELNSVIKKMDTYDPSMDKNTILVLCVDEQVKLFEEMTRIEEDAYTFKKNVLRYSKESIAELRTNLNGDYCVQNLSTLLFNSDQFDHMKNNSVISCYRLLTNLFIKLPMLTVDNNKIRKIKNIKEKIMSRLSKDNLAMLLDATQQVNWDTVETYEDISHLCILLNEV